ncbi:MAG: CapA family protein [Chloroflexi bacterium]|nr:CapA family protein [Chloroflexota bacterium]
MAKGSISLCAVGDLCIKRDDADSILDMARPTLKKADVLFGQLETNISDRGAPQVHAGSPMRAATKSISAYTGAGFDVLSFASNHTLDWGNEALADTIEITKRNGIQTIGVGENLAEARRPAIVECEGVKVGFLAYSSIIPAGYAASSEKPGCAPIRVSTFYEAIEFQPGTPCRIITIPNRQDMQDLKEDIEALRPNVDVLVVSMHWGVHFVPAVVATYQVDVGRAALDWGADIILGHHAHILKGIEVYKGKVIFYSLGNFAFDQLLARRLSSARARESQELYKFELDPEYPTYAFPADSRKSMIAKCDIVDGRIDRVCYLPVMMNKNGQPEVLPPGDPRAQEVFDYVAWTIQDQKLNATFRYEGGEAIVQT